MAKAEMQKDASDRRTIIVLQMDIIIQVFFACDAYISLVTQCNTHTIPS